MSNNLLTIEESAKEIFSCVKLHANTWINSTPNPSLPRLMEFILFSSSYVLYKIEKDYPSIFNEFDNYYSEELIKFTNDRDIKKMVLTTEDYFILRMGKYFESIEKYYNNGRGIIPNEFIYNFHENPDLLPYKLSREEMMHIDIRIKVSLKYFHDMLKFSLENKFTLNN